VLRRHPGNLSASEQSLTKALTELIREGRVALLGPIRQELLSGIREEAQFEKIRRYLRVFEEPLLEAVDYEEAARMSNQCRTRGISGSAVDFLICAAANRPKWAIFTTDLDFQRYASVLPLRLYRT
jgi:predicted nucleic acid-binding protein